MNELKELRVRKKITQQSAADMMGVSLRSYKAYENEANKVGTIKYNFMLHKLEEYNKIDENHGILELSDIEEACEKVFEKYKVNFCYLFGSYAKGKAKEDSDVDLLVSCQVTGLKFYGLVEELRENLHKNVDVLGIEQLKDNLELTVEIMGDGIKIYG